MMSNLKYFNINIKIFKSEWFMLHCMDINLVKNFTLAFK